VTLAVILAYLALVLLIGGVSHVLFRGTSEDYFLATRTIGPFMLLMSLFGTHMTAFSLLGASGQGYLSGIGVFGLMASSSALVVPVVFYFVGTRLWSLGARHGFITQVQFFRARWESEGLGLLLFCVLIALLVPYLLIGVMGGGIALNQITSGQVSEWAGSLGICVVVVIYVTFGGLRGTAWANTFQTLVFMTLGGVTFFWIVREMGGLDAALAEVARQRPELLVRGEKIPPLKMLTYFLVPLSVGMFPHIFMHWLTARRASTFRLAIVGYPLCVAAVWLPSVLLGVIGTIDVPGLSGPAANSILVQMIQRHAPGLLAGLLGAGVFAAIMSSLDSQVLSLGTMFTQDIVKHYGFQDRMSERAQILAGRLFVAGILLVTYLISLGAPRSIFSLGIWSFTGYAALFPVVLAALFWRGSTRHGVAASVLSVVVLWLFFFVRAGTSPGYTVGATGILPVAVILPVACVVLVGVSAITKAPGTEYLERFFGDGRAAAEAER
jgi:SSS family solute:Na+ symporter